MTRRRRGRPTAHAAADPARPARVRRIGARPGAARRDRRPAADDGRRRVRHRLPRLGVDRHRADARGGRRVLVDRPGRDRARAAAVRDARGADRRGSGPAWRSTASRPSTATPGCSTSRAQGWGFTIARRWLYDTADSVRLAALARVELRAARRDRGQDPARGALPPDASRRVARAPGTRHRQAARRGHCRADDARARSRCPFSRHCPTRSCSSHAGVLAAPMAELADRWRSEANARLGALEPAPPSPDGRPPADGRDRAQPDESFVWLWNEFTSVARLEEGAQW